MMTTIKSIKVEVIKTAQGILLLAIKTKTEKAVSEYFRISVEPFAICFYVWLLMLAVSGKSFGAFGID